ncbi:alcohol dehydrogenase catalytic domain-containing protein [Aeromonas aquatilis]
MDHIDTQGWCWHGPGGPEQLVMTPLLLSGPGLGEVLVENRVVAINPVDWKLMERGHSAWLPGQVPGVDGMGVIRAVGPDVTHLRVGSRVAYHTDLRRHGSFALHTIVPARALGSPGHSFRQSGRSLSLPRSYCLAGAEQATKYPRGSGTNHWRRK